MLIKKGGIYRNIESKNFLHYKAQGYEVEEPTASKEDSEQPETPNSEKSEQPETPDSEKSEKSKGK